MATGSRFDLVFMDVQMPNLDGIQSTKLIREMGFSAPIVALTAFAEKSNEDECMASGMDYFLAKPIRRPALKHVLKKYCATIPEEDSELASPKILDQKTQALTQSGGTASASQSTPDPKATVNGVAHLNGEVFPHDISSSS
jgi:osomolarity two-component system, sensor histidine kinase SLN1